MAGYSGTPLPRKLGLPATGRAVLIDAPAGFTKLLGKLPPALELTPRLGRGEAYVHIFATESATLGKRFVTAARALDKAGTLWVSWPKKASGVATDLTEDVVRAIGLEAGLVDVKVCAVDDVWSGLKFMYRLRDR